MKRLLYVEWERVPDSGGALVTARNKRWLSDWCGELNFRPVNPGWRAFYPSPHHWKMFIAMILAGGRGERFLFRELKAFDPDWIVLDNSSIALPEKIWSGYRTLVFCHNVEADYARAGGAREWETAQIKSAEETAIRQATRIVALSEQDSSRLRELYGRGADYVLPITLEDKGWDVSPAANVSATGDMLFVGSDFFGNTEGLFWFIEKCLPMIGRKLIVVGRGMERYRGKFAELEARGLLEIRGFVANLGQLYRNAETVVLPIRSGSGMKTKTIEALMYGRRIYGTPEAFVGCKGIESVATCCTDANSFIRELRKPSPATGARQYFLDHFSSDSQRPRFHRWLQEVMQ